MRTTPIIFLTPDLNRVLGFADGTKPMCAETFAPERPGVAVGGLTLPARNSTSILALFYTYLRGMWCREFPWAKALGTVEKQLARGGQFHQTNR